MFEIREAKDGSYLILVGNVVFGRFPDLENCLLAHSRLTEWWKREELPAPVRVEAAIKELIYHDKITGEFGRRVRGYWVGLKVEGGDVRVLVSEVPEESSV